MIIYPSSMLQRWELTSLHLIWDAEVKKMASMQMSFHYRMYMFNELKQISLNNDQCTVGSMTMKSTRRVRGHSLLRSLVRSHRSLIRLLRTARFARALRCAHSFARSLTRSLRSSWERGFCLQNERLDFISFEPIVGSNAVPHRTAILQPQLEIMIKATFATPSSAQRSDRWLDRSMHRSRARFKWLMVQLLTSRIWGIKINAPDVLRKYFVAFMSKAPTSRIS